VSHPLLLVTQVPSFFLSSVRAPTADLPNTAAFVGGVIAQEAIKMITKQYVPQRGYCAIDLVQTWTGFVDA
jgi:amyloid beta precursor protein binding protein 1